MTYERQTELHEGLAQYVELRALNRSPRALLGLARESCAVRRRAYATGAARGFLLDAFSPRWKLAFQTGETSSLDDYLLAALPGSDGAAFPFSGEVRADSLEHAGALVAQDQDRQRQARQAFVQHPGWQLRFSADDPSFQTLGFDPLNVTPLGSGEVLHTRYLKLGQATGSVEVLDLAALTTAAGEHPLFSGIRTLLVTGLSGEPTVRTRRDGIAIEATGLSGVFTGARVERDDVRGRVTVRLAASTGRESGSNASSLL